MAVLLCHSEAAQFAAKNPDWPFGGSSTEETIGIPSLHSEWQNQVPISNIRSNATLDQYFTWSATRMRLTTLPSTRFSSAHARCCGEIRNIVVHRHPESSSVMTFFLCSAKRLPMRLTRWISVRTATIDPAG